MGAVAALPLILAGFQAAIQAAPQVIALLESAKNYIAGLFSAGLISKEVQDACFLHLEGISALARAGIVPPSWQVQPDPVTAATFTGTDVVIHS